MTENARQASSAASPRWRVGLAWLATGLLGVGLPLAVSWQTAATFYTPKLGFLYAGVSVAVLASVHLSGRTTGDGGDQADPGRGLSVAGAAAAAFVLWGLVVVLTTDSHWVALLGTYNQGTGWLFWVASLAIWESFRRLWPRGGWRVGLFTVVLVAGVAVALLALLQAGHWEPLRFKLGFRADGRSGSTLGNPLYLGSYLALVLVCGLDLLGGALRRTATPRRLVGILLVVITLGTIIAGLVATRSRGALLGAGAGIIVWAALSFVRSGTSRKVVATLMVLPLVAMAVGWVAYPSPTATAVRSATVPGQATTASVAGYDTIHTRLLMWRVAGRAIADRPVLGWGQNGFRFAAERHMVAEKLEAEPLTRDADAHNLLLEIAATWGLPGALLLCAWVLAVMVALLRTRRVEGSGVALGIGVMAAFLVASLTAPQNIVVTPVALLLVGFAQARATEGRAETGSSGSRAVARIRRGLIEWGSVVIWTGALIVAVLAVLGGYWIYSADAAYQRGELGVSSTGSPLAELRRAAHRVPVNEYYWLALGQTQAREGLSTGQLSLMDDAIGSLRRGLALTPRDADLLAALSGLYLQEKDWADAQAVADEGVGYAPMEPQLRANLAYALVKLGQTRDALAQADRALAVKTGDARVLYTVALTYREAHEVDRARQLLQQSLQIRPDFAAARSALADLGGQ